MKTERQKDIYLVTKTEINRKRGRDRVTETKSQNRGIKIKR